MDGIPSDRGVYAVHLRLDRVQVLQVGRLGKLNFQNGDYVYLGSALGSGGIRARLGRHVSGVSSVHWHIDVLRAVAEVRGYCYHVQCEVENIAKYRLKAGPELNLMPLECIWTQALAALPIVYIPAPGFGSSDCNSGCGAHLVVFDTDYQHLKKIEILNLVGKMLIEASGINRDEVCCFEYIAI
jgi:Uri superfamily endonuclease